MRSRAAPLTERGAANSLHDEHPPLRKHDHKFGQDRKRPGEQRTLIVIAITGVMTIVEVISGILFGSMALLADGLHMASHAAALGINAFAYIYARRQAGNPDFSFGTGKVNALGGFSGAVLLAVFALLMAGESLSRLMSPVAINFDQAIFIAALGLAVNAASVAVLGIKTASPESRVGSPPAVPHDHNLRSAYLHVLADALTSVLAILALLAAKYLGFVWMDPLTGIIGAALVARWSLGLLRTSGGILLDRQGPKQIRDTIQRRIESDGDSRISDLHLWSIGPGLYAAVISVSARRPETPDQYKARLPGNLGLKHVSIEVHACETDRAG